MMKDVKISSYQLSMLLMGFLFGSTAVLNPATAAHQDAWLAYILGWGGGFILIGMYSSIALLNPSRNLFEILEESLGRMLGSFVSVFYIWYFIHLASLVLRNIGEYSVVTAYTDTPILFIIIVFVLVIAYAVRNGLEVMAKASELIVPIALLLVLALFFALIGQYRLIHFMPFLAKGFRPVMKAAFTTMSFPFGETIAFLMIFPHLNNRKILRTSFLSTAIMGGLILSALVRDLTLMGPFTMDRTVFPPSLSAELIPDLDLDPLINANLLIGAGIKISICIYAATMGITQLFKLDDYKTFVLPVVVIVISLSVWIYENIFQMLNWIEIYPYYALPFQVMFPLCIWIISLMRKRQLGQVEEQ